MLVIFQFSNQEHPCVNCQTHLQQDDLASTSSQLVTYGIKLTTV